MAYAQGKDIHQHVYRRQVAVTPSDTENLPNGDAAIYCLTAGNLVVWDCANNPITYALTAGQFAPIVARRVLATGTTGTYVALF